MGIPICRRRFPLLLVPDHIDSQVIEEEQIIEEDDDDTLISIYNNGRRSLYCLLLEKPLQFQIELPPQFHKTHSFCGSSHGWLIASIVDDQDILHITLFNPFSTAILNLPPITQNLTELPYLREKFVNCKNTLDIYHNYFVHKAVLSCDPSSNPNDYVVMVIYDSFNRLAFIRPGTDSTWTFLDRDIYKLPIVDVIYYKGKVFAVDCDGMVVCCEAVDHNNWTTRMVSQVPTIIHPSDRKYLVESLDGELLQVDRDYDVDHERHNSAELKATKFQVFKLMKDPINDFGNSETEWMEIKNIGDCALFVGGNESISIRASDIDGCRSNSIYFTAHAIEYTHPGADQFGYTDMGVYDIENGTIEPIHYNTPAMSCQTPIWITNVNDDLN